MMTTADEEAYQHNEAAHTEEAVSKGHAVQTHGGGPMRIPSRPPWSLQFNSPFLRQDADRVATRLKRDFARTQLNIEFFAILDEKSLEERTALVVDAKHSRQDGREGVQTARQPFEEVNAVLVCWSIGEGSIGEALTNGAPER